MRFDSAVGDDVSVRFSWWLISAYAFHLADAIALLNSETGDRLSDILRE